MDIGSIEIKETPIGDENCILHECFKIHLVIEIKETPIGDENSHIATMFVAVS